MPKRPRLDSDAAAPIRVLPKRSHVCPVCSNPVPIADLTAHYAYERRRLSGPSPTNKRPAAVVALAKITDHPRVAKRTEVSTLIARVRANRESRRNNHIDDIEEGQAEECPICGLRLIGIGTTASEHVSSCLDLQVQEEEREENSWNVYQVAGQTRVRAIGLLEGGVRSIPDAVIHTDDDGVDVIVDVEGDADAVYGRSQYTEADLVNPDSITTIEKRSG